ncbi:YdcH family protein [Edaphobacter acidisoli]|nr:YdcH family protein [Edaphobacter acidisoli]
MQTARFTELPQASSLPSIHQLMQEHSLYDRRLETLRAKVYLTEAEKMEEVRLKKMKLHLKDEMERLRRLGAPSPEN